MSEQKSKRSAKTTGHEWDGIRELDNPVPHLLKWAYIGAILWSAVTWSLFPSWPWIDRVWNGILDYSSREAVTDAFNDLTSRRIQSDPRLMSPAEIVASGSSLFADNCSACHGRDLRGQLGYPDLKDRHWLWSDDFFEVAATIKYGINTDHPDTRFSEMPAFGVDGLLSRDEISALAKYVYELATTDPDHDGATAVLFSENCSGCHGDHGKGGLGMGAPALNDEAWLYGGEIEDIRRSIYGGRMGIMPDWDRRLSDHQIETIAAYLGVLQNANTE